MPTPSMTMVGKGGEGRVELGWPKFGGLDDEENMYDAMEFNNVESEGGEIGNATGIKHDYCDETWNQEQFTYDSKS
jgi:hypothetical protein